MRVTVANVVIASLVVSDTSVTVSEAGGTATYTVALAAEPTDTVTVMAVSSDTAAAVVSPTMLRFAPTDWNVATDR